MQTRVGSVLAASVSVSQYELCSVGVESLVLLVSLVSPLALSTSSSSGFPDGDAPFRAVCSTLSPLNV